MCSKPKVDDGGQQPIADDRYEGSNPNDFFPLGVYLYSYSRIWVRVGTRKLNNSSHSSSVNSSWAALGVSLVPTVMQMRCIVWEPSDWFRWGTMVRKSEVIGNGRKSSEKFGSRKSTEMVGSRRRSSAGGSRRSRKVIKYSKPVNWSSVFPFLLTIRSEKKKQKTKQQKTKNKNIHWWNSWCRIKNYYMSLHLFELACWNGLRAGKKVV